MNLLKTILEAQGGGAVSQVASALGLEQKQASSGIAKLLPALTQGLTKNMGSENGLQSLLGALDKGGHDRYLDNPAALSDERAVQEGNGILGHLLGSKDVSRQVASQAASETGLDVGVLKKMLPMVAAMAMGGMKKQTAASGLLGGQQSSSGVAGMLGKFLDSDGDGSMADDLLGMAKKLF
ncbi:MAG: DUF937 domain-containing protein [Pseudomonadota bacterium]